MTRRRPVYRHAGCRWWRPKRAADPMCCRPRASLEYSCAPVTMEPAAMGCLGYSRGAKALEPAGDRPELAGDKPEPADDKPEPADGRPELGGDKPGGDKPAAGVCRV